MILIDVFASDSSNTTVGGCAAMGGLLQFTALFQFLWILALVGNTAVYSVTVSACISIHYHTAGTGDLLVCMFLDRSHSWSGNETSVGIN